MSLKNTFRPPAVGDTVTFSKTMTVAEQAMFTGLSGNLGGLYVDRTKAAEVGLKDMAVFELAVAALLTTCLTRLAGPGYRIATFDTAFEKPLTVGVTVEAEARLEVDDGANLGFALACRAAGETVVTGRAMMVEAGG